MACLVGQGYDGATVMSSSKKGVQGKIAATYVHCGCRSYVLNLAISSGCTAVSQFATFLITLIN